MWRSFDNLNDRKATQALTAFASDLAIVMAHTEIKALSGKLSAKQVKTRQMNGLNLSAIEGWHAVAEANRIFGFGGWERGTVETRCVWQGRGKAPLRRR